jgi:hypothetical protein
MMNIIKKYVVDVFQFNIFFLISIPELRTAFRWCKKVAFRRPAAAPFPPAAPPQMLSVTSHLNNNQNY